MRRLDAERVEDADASAAMSASVYGALDAQAEGEAQRIERQVRHAALVEALAEADVAVVEADDAKAARDELLDEAPRASRAAACPGP